MCWTSLPEPRRFGEDEGEFGWSHCRPDYGDPARLRSIRLPRARRRERGERRSRWRLGRPEFAIRLNSETDDYRARNAIKKEKGDLNGAFEDLTSALLVDPCSAKDYSDHASNNRTDQHAPPAGGGPQTMAIMRLPVLGVQQRLLARAKRIVAGRFQSALLIALANLPGGLGGDPYPGCGFHRAPACVHLPQHQCPNHRPHRLHSAQQLLDPPPFLPRKLNLQSLTLVHASAIPLAAVWKKCQP